MKYFFPALISAFVLSACSFVGESGDCGLTGPDQSSDNIMLSFKVISSDAGYSRSDQFHNEEDSYWPEFEDRINLSDFAFYVFLENGTDDNLWPLVMKNTNIAASTSANNMVSGSLGVYTVTSIIPKKNFERLVGHELDPNSTTAVRFRLVLIANAGLTKDQYSALAPVEPTTDTATPTTIAQFMEAAEKLAVNVNTIYTATASATDISSLYRRNIPMYGNLSCTTSEDILYRSSPDDRIFLGTVYMLRSLAKVEVLDEATKNTDGYPRVTGVKVSTSTNMTAVLPADASSYSNGDQVHTAKPVDKYNSDDKNTNNTDFILGTRAVNTARRFGYIPEQQIQYGSPTLTITAELSPNEFKNYEVHMDGFDNAFGSYILRNHIYRLKVNSISAGTPVDIKLEVKQWEGVDNKLDYSENVSVSNAMAWISGTYEGTVDVENSTVNILPWANAGATDVQRPLVGTFGIQTPVGAIWSASFIDLSGEYGSFAFLHIDPEDPNKKEFIKNEDGTYANFPSVSGLIDGKTLSTIYIVSTNPNPTDYQTARLQVLVALPDGSSIIEADLCPKKNQSNYTIVQRPLL